MGEKPFVLFFTLNFRNATIRSRASYSLSVTLNMERKKILLEQLKRLEFNGKISCMDELYQSIQALQFYFEAQGKVCQEWAHAMKCCTWDLKMRLAQDQEEQWIWTFEWVKNKVLRKFGLELIQEPEPEMTEKASLPYRYFTGLSRNYVRESGFVYTHSHSRDTLSLNRS